MPSTEILSSKGIMITKPHELLAIKEREISEGEKVIEAMMAIPNISKAKLARVKGRVLFMKRFVAKLKEGFLPIPRMVYDDVAHAWNGTITIDNLPIEAIVTIRDFQNKFDALGLVRPSVGRSRWGRQRRDPFLIGIIRYGHREEHFMLAWWRPDTMLSSQLW